MKRKRRLAMGFAAARKLRYPSRRVVAKGRRRVGGRFVRRVSSDDEADAREEEEYEEEER